MSTRPYGLAGRSTSPVGRTVNPPNVDQNHPLRPWCASRGSPTMRWGPDRPAPVGVGEEPVTLLLTVLAGWLVLSLPVGLVVGRALAAQEAASTSPSHRQSLT